MGKQLVNFITWGCESSAPFFVPYLGLHNVQDFAQILYFVGGVRIIMANLMSMQLHQMANIMSTQLHKMANLMSMQHQMANIISVLARPFLQGAAPALVRVTCQ
jgi:hypothetical protein